ncbi:DUF397 domain-containing protein [Streptomyces sp. NPDC003077]|uniref:DUF397 domain-containing protein n=1 Tax=Streptomyces sp. NPDC003077 TaxID=3154443 RepID=UPI0033A339E7
MAHLVWQKSTYSDGAGANCVEIAANYPVLHLRESDHPNHILTTTPTALRALILTLKNDTAHSPRV